MQAYTQALGNMKKRLCVKLSENQERDIVTLFKGYNTNFPLDLHATTNYRMPVSDLNYDVTKAMNIP